MVLKEHGGKDGMELAPNRGGKGGTAVPPPKMSYNNPKKNRFG